MPFGVRSRQADGVTVVEVGGEVDVETAPRMRAALDDAVRAGLPVVVDIGAVTFMDSFGFGVLAAAHQAGARAGTPVLLRGVSNRIRRLLGLLGLDAVLTIEAPDGQPGTGGAARPGSWGSDRDGPLPEGPSRSTGITPTPDAPA